VSGPSAAAAPRRRIEDVSAGDADAIAQAAALLVAAFPRWTPTLTAAREEIAALLASDHICLGAYADDALLGWVGASPAYSHAWELHPLVVREDARRQGVGRALVAALEDRVRRRGALTLYLGADDDGPAPRTSAGGIDLFPGALAHAAALRAADHPVGFYRRLGFEVVGLIPDANGPGKPDVLMAKRVAGGGTEPAACAARTGHRLDAGGTSALPGVPR
jgi:aminoglycoside 6'-N-acetyltransferase I